ncbi:MAG: helix-turn-helix domain-containing protein [Minwuia sp.]|nr:helix-turn-helix domain-containing protein [Minwuia sp.]
MQIQELRQEQGWTQEELALHSGLSVRTIQRIESGRPATLESLKCLAAVFATSVADLTMEKPVMTEMKDNEGTTRERGLERAAIRYVKRLKRFHFHWITYAVTLPCLLMLNLYLNPDRLWVVTVALGWGFGLMLHAVWLFGMAGLFGAEWEQRQFRKRMEQISGN